MFIDILIILNNFFHDLAAAMWFCGTLTLLFIYRKLDGQDKGNRDFAYSLFTQVKQITNWSLFFVVLGGIVRAVNYQQYEWLPFLGRGQVTLLIIKHILITVIVLGGIFIQMRLSSNIKKL